MPSNSETLYKKLRKSWRRGKLFEALRFRRGTKILADRGAYKFFVDSRDKIVGRSLRRTGAYEPEEFTRIASLATPHSDVLFVGAHIGALAIPTAGLCQRIAMIEANPDTFALLSENCALNAINNCDLHNLAAGDSDDSIRFIKNTHNSGGSKREPLISDDIYYYDEPEVTDVRMCVLDRLFQDRKFELVVMDIEGSEYFALKGMPRILSVARYLIVEFVPHHLTNVAGVTVDDFLDLILPYFSKLTVPSTNRIVEGDTIRAELQAMFDAGQTDGGLIFEKP